MILVALFLISFLAFFLITRNRKTQVVPVNITSKPKKSIPGRADFLQDAVSGNDMLNVFDEISDKYSEHGIANFMFGPVKITLLWDADLIETLTNCSAAQSKGEFLQILLGRVANGAFAHPGGQEWKELAKPLTHSMAKKYMENDYFNEFVHQTHCLIDFFKRNREGKIYDLHDDICASAFDTFSFTHMGVRSNELIERRWKHSELVERVFISSIEDLLTINNFLWKIIRIFKQLTLWIINFIPRYNFFNTMQTHEVEFNNAENIKPTKGLFESIMLRISQMFGRCSLFFLSFVGFYMNEVNLTFTETARKLNECEKLGNRCIEWVFETRKQCGVKRTDGLEYYSDFLIRRQKELKLSQKKINRHLTDVMVAGSDTTPHAVTSALLFMAMNPDIQERVFKEQEDIFGDSDRDPTIEDLSNMPYLGMVVKETVRLVSAAGFLKFTEAACQIGDYELPKASLVYVYLKRLHRDPKYFEKPIMFYPDHFLPEVEATRPRYAYIPFGIGLRKCPGSLYATIMMKVMISMIVRNFSLKTSMKMENVIFDFNVMLAVRGGYPIEMTSRKITTPRK